MVNLTSEIIDLLKTKYHLRVQLSKGESARLIGPVHQIYLTVGRKEEKFHLGDQDLEDLIAYLAGKDLGLDFQPTDMYEMKKQLKALTNETPEPAPVN
jgi:hypothetical protein